MIRDKRVFELRWLERFRVAAGLEFEKVSADCGRKLALDRR